MPGVRSEHLMRGLWHGVLAVICGSAVILLAAGPTTSSRTYYPEMVFGLCVFLGPIGMLVGVIAYGGLQVLFRGPGRAWTSGLAGWI